MYAFNAWETGDGCFLKFHVELKIDVIAVLAMLGCLERLWSARDGKGANGWIR